MNANFHNLDLSIIIPAFNCSETIERCLDSLVKQETHCEFEIVAINDGSTDSTVQVLDKWSRIDSRIKVFSQENRGVSAARNAGIRLCKGSSITFVDADDFISPDYIENLMAAKTASVDLVVSEAADVLDDGSVVYTKHTTEQISLKCDDSYDIDAPYAHSTSWGCIYDRKLIQGVYFDETLTVGEDTLFYYTALTKAKTAVHIPYVGYYYVYNSSSATKCERARRYLDDSIAWQRVADLFLNSRGLYSQCIAMSVRHAAMGVIKVRKECSDDITKLRRYIAENAASTVKFCLGNKSYRRAVLIMIAYIKVVLIPQKTN